MQEGAPIRILSVGHLEAQKSPEIQINAAHLLLQHRNDFIWTWIGDGSLMNKCRQQVQALGLEKHFLLEGRKNRMEIAELLTDSDLFVMSSVYENCPVALIEAQCVGLPCIVRKNGASEHVLIEGNGKAIEMNVESESLCTAILELNNDNLDSQAIKERGSCTFHPKTFAQNMWRALQTT